METRKIAWACFIGGALCAAVALIFSPAFLWLGVLAGVAGGYVSYEFRATLLAIPIAWRQTVGKGYKIGKEVYLRLRDYVQVKHPFVYSAVVLALPVTVWLISQIYGETPRDLLWILLMAPVAFIDVVFLMTGFLFAFASLGCRREGCYWEYGRYDPIQSEEVWRRFEREWQKDGYSEKPLTYGNAWRWLAIGSGVVLVFLLWTWWTWLLRLGARFFWNLVRLISSKEREVCSICGTVGGLISYFWFATSAASLGEMILLVIYGGLLGAVLGVVYWEVVSKRLLKVTAK